MDNTADKTYNSVPFLTVVMPVRNEEEYIEETLNQILQQDYPIDKYEIIVADGMSDDETQNIVNRMSKTYSQILLLPSYLKRSSSGRNVGFKAGKGELFIVIDGHCNIPDNQLFKSTASIFMKTGAFCLGRPQPLDPPGISMFQRAVAKARGSWFGHGLASHIYDNYEGFASTISNGASYNRKVFDIIGYVDERFSACEDVEFNYRIQKAGLLTYTSPLLTIQYYPRQTLGSLFKQMLRYGVGRSRLFWKHPESLEVTTVIPSLFVVGILVTVLTAIVAPHTASLIVMLSAYASYAIISIVESLRLSKLVNARYIVILPLIYFVIHTGLGLGFITGLCDFRKMKI